MTKPALAPVGDNSEVKNIITRLLKLLDEQDDIGESIKDLRKEAKDKGIDSKALNLAIREHRKPVDSKTKVLTNMYFVNSGGQYEIFTQ